MFQQTNTHDLKKFEFLQLLIIIKEILSCIKGLYHEKNIVTNWYCYGLHTND